MTSQLFNLCELRQILATDFASEVSLTVGIVFIRITCKLFEFIGFLYSGHVTFRICHDSEKLKKPSMEPGGAKDSSIFRI